MFHLKKKIAFERPDHIFSALCMNANRLSGNLMIFSCHKSLNNVKRYVNENLPCWQMQ